jgi:hypothetical protein
MISHSKKLHLSENNFLMVGGDARYNKNAQGLMSVSSTCSSLSVTKYVSNRRGFVKGNMNHG